MHTMDALCVAALVALCVGSSDDNTRPDTDLSGRCIGTAVVDAQGIDAHRHMKQDSVLFLTSRIRRAIFWYRSSICRWFVWKYQKIPLLLC
mmetsp:Transcript_20491/g.58518  ORF Transcript_20491/g.58518 Transcript_20491/m.58518 type:complete len:91 (-) Transcript_20491:928-1200(-)